ncbi:MAG TPA: HNH endonuclease [Verrucomicrobiales bacterium]|nr:HNH endonuclease [Verrucomicrobiales bacterium]
MSGGLRALIETRANGRCEYCMAPVAICAYTFHIEHCIPRSAGGSSDASNLALACAACNLRKSTHTSALDPETNNKVALFHPVKEKWANHFQLKGTLIIGRTSTGRATAAFLQLNSPRRRAARAAWLATGLWP